MQHFPIFFSPEDSPRIGAPVSLDEIKGVLKYFAKDNGPGPDGWTVDFYLAFFSLIGQDMFIVEGRGRGLHLW